MDTLKGCMFGAALADAIGMTREFKGKCKPHKIIFPYTEDIREWKANDWTDDTDQMILLLELMIEKKLTQLEFAKKLHNWKDNGFKELGDTAGRGIGGCTMQVVGDGQFLINPTSAAAAAWQLSGYKLAPNGSLMRTAILSFTNSYLINSELMCRVTHSDPRCIAACLILNEGIRLIMYGKFNQLKKNAVKPGLKYLMGETSCPQMGVRGSSNRWVNQKYYIRGKSGIKYNYPQELIDYVNASVDLNNLQLADRIKLGYVYKCLGCALWAFAQVEYADYTHKVLDYITLIKQIVVFGGDADTNAVVAGAIFGSYLGYVNLYKQTSKEINAMPHSQWLMNKINQLGADSNSDSNLDNNKHNKYSDSPLAHTIPISLHLMNDSETDFETDFETEHETKHSMYNTNVTSTLPDNNDIIQQFLIDSSSTTDNDNLDDQTKNDLFNAAFDDKFNLDDEEENIIDELF